MHIENIVGKTVTRFHSKVSDCETPMRQDVRDFLQQSPSRLGDQAVDVFPGFIFWGGHFGLAILLRPSHESLLLRGGAEWGYQKLRGLRRSDSVHRFKLNWRHIMRFGGRNTNAAMVIWKTTVAGLKSFLRLQPSR